MSWANALRARKEAAAAKAKPKGKAKSKVAPYEPKYPPLPEGMLSQPEAKALMPPGSSIWRALTSGGWCCHVLGYSRASFPWHLWGGRDSVFECIRAAWRMHLQREALSLHGCPIQGVFRRTSSKAVRSRCSVCLDKACGNPKLFAISKVAQTFYLHAVQI